ncbi:MAG: replication-relaxation family protein [Solirubrobacteraceae bacterium]
MSYPAGYPIASSTSAGPTAAGVRFRRVPPTKDLRSSPHISARKLAGIRQRLSDRDLEILAAVARFRALSGEQLQRLFWPEGSPETRARLARHGLARLSRLSVISPLARRVGGVRSGSQGLTFALGIAGQRLLAAEGSTRRARYPHTPGERYLAHTLAVARVYVELVERSRQGACELLAYDPEPACWRPYLAGFGTRVVLKPDAYAKLGSGEYLYSWLLELDMASEALPTIERKARRHLDYHRSGEARRTHGVAPRVLWITPDEHRAQAIHRVLEALPPEAARLFVVTTAKQAVSVLTGEAQR